MKQPKVSAAITLNEKANSEFARDSTVFIAAVSSEPCSTLTTRTLFRPRTGSLRSAPPALRALRGRAPPPPRLLSGPPSARAAASRDTPTRRRDRAERPTLSRARARPSSPHQSATYRGGAGFLHGWPARVLASCARARGLAHRPFSVFTSCAGGLWVPACFCFIKLYLKSEAKQDSLERVPTFRIR